MVVTEDKRHRLYGKLEETLGTEEAETMMQLLPPSGWDDVARQSDLLLVKKDIQSLDAKLTARIDKVDAKVDSLDEKLTGKIESLDSKLTGRIDALDEKLELAVRQVTAEFKAALAETKDELKDFSKWPVQLFLSVMGVIVATGTVAIAIIQAAG